MATFSQQTNWIEEAERYIQASKAIRDQLNLGTEVSAETIALQVRELVHANGGLGCRIADGQLITKSSDRAKEVEDEVELLILAAIRQAKGRGTIPISRSLG